MEAAEERVARNLGHVQRAQDSLAAALRLREESRAALAALVDLQRAEIAQHVGGGAPPAVGGGMDGG
eukprot:7176131-Lingulodinium_polyedra.AAC.1